MAIYDQIMTSEKNRIDAMQADKLLHKLLVESSVIGHEKRLNSLLRAVEGVTHEGKLSLTNIGRHLKSEIKVKNKIKAVDRLLGNQNLMSEREGIYDIVSATLLAGMKEALVLVDWSPCANHENQLLKASVVLKGRSMTLYEEVHPEKKLGNYDVHVEFLERLKKKIPAGVKVIIVTDAGFRTEWFELVRKMGWDFIGRIRSNMQFQYQDTDSWIPCSSIYSQATSQIKCLGDVLLSKERELPATMYLYHDKQARKKVEKSTKPKKKSGKSDYARANKEPWLLVTSLTGGLRASQQTVSRYRYRMRIEHEFRSTKNSQWGIGLENTLTRNAQRLQILLLIGYLAIFILWLIGLAAEFKELHYDYQANTIKKRRVLSLVFLGLQIIRHQPQIITERDITDAFIQVRKIHV